MFSKKSLTDSMIKDQLSLNTLSIKYQPDSYWHEAYRDILAAYFIGKVFLWSWLVLSKTGNVEIST